MNIVHNKPRLSDVSSRILGHYGLSAKRYNRKLHPPSLQYAHNLQLH